MPKEFEYKEEAINRIVAWLKIYEIEGMRWGQSPSLSATRICQNYDDSDLLDGNILDIGCGYGRDVVFFAENFHKRQVIGLDAAITALPLWKTILRKINDTSVLSRCWFQLCDFMALGALIKPIHPVALVHFNYVFHLLNTREVSTVFQRMGKILKSGGLLVASFVSTEDPHCITSKGNGTQRINTEDGPWTCYNRDAVETLISDNEYKIVNLCHEIEIEKKRGIDDEVRMWHLIAKKV